MPNLSDYHPLHGKRILHVCSNVKFKGKIAQLETDSNWKVLTDTVNFLPMCHHYILVSDSSTLVRRTGSEDKKTLKYHFDESHPFLKMPNVTLIPFTYPQSVLSNRAGFDLQRLKRIFNGDERVYYKPGQWTKLECSSIDIDFVFCHQPEILSNVLWALLTLRYGMNNTDGIPFFHWVDCPASAPAGLFPPTFFRHLEAVDWSTKSFVHGSASLEYWKDNWKNERSHIIDINKSIEDKLSFMPLAANPLPSQDCGLWKPKVGEKAIAFNHRWHTTTGRDILPNYMEGLPPEYVVYVTDKVISKKDTFGKSYESSSSIVDEEDLSVGNDTSKFEESEDGRLKYAYTGYKGRPQETSYELYADFLRNCYASVGIIKGYGTWNLSVQDPIGLGTPTLVYDTPMMRDVLGSEYPFYFKTKEEFQKKIQNLPEKMDYKLRDFKSEFKQNLMNAMLQSRNHTKFHDKEGMFGGPWLYFMSKGLTYKKDMLYQTHQNLVDGQNSNSWETIRRWVKQWGVKDDPNSRYTKLHIPDDAHEAHRRLEDYLKNDKHERPVSMFPKELPRHKKFTTLVNSENKNVDLSSFFS